MPPRSLKSFCISSALPAYLLGHDPSLEIVNISYGDTLVRAHTRIFRQIMHAPFFKKTFPDAVISSMKDNETESLTTKGGARLGVPMEGGITGRGGNMIIIDDPMKAQDAYSDTERERCYRNFTSTISTRVNNPATVRTIITMQRLHEDDLVGRLLAQGGFKHLNIPAIAMEEQTYKTGSGPNDVHHVLPDDLMHPERLTNEFLEEQRQTMGTSAFSAQFLQNPVPEDGEMFKRDWVGRYPGDPNPKNYGQIIQSWDTAIKTGVNHDYSACVTVGVRQGEVHVLDAIERKLPLHSLQVLAAEHAIKWGAHVVLVEDANLGTELARYLLRCIRAAVIPIVPKGAKELRVSTAAAQAQAGRLFLPKKPLPWLDSLERQMFGFPNAKNDDLVDALAQVLIWYAQGGLPQIEARVTLIGEGGAKVAHQSTYYDRMGGSFPF